ncbi:MAG: DnaJ domain-containing protein [Clostridiales bacterium]|nr:DnaJ domain-containing protein [Clostridiales bacterium]
MNNYYTLLNIEQTADAQEIKRAYYTMVKRYPPERFPEEFKALRGAYDVLSNEKKRKEYDAVYNLPEETLTLIHMADEYLEKGNVGKSITVWAKLVERYPVNTRFHISLGKAYSKRGWKNKAVAEFNKALEMDCSCADAWESMAIHYVTEYKTDEARKICVKGIEKLKECGQTSFGLYILALTIILSCDADSAEPIFIEFTDIIRTNGIAVDEAAPTMLSGLLVCVFQKKAWAYGKYIEKIANAIPFIPLELRDHLEKIRVLESIAALDPKRYHEFIKDLLELLVLVSINEMDSEYRYEQLLIECSIIQEINVCRNQILRLKGEHPDLYKMHASFFNDLLRNRSTKRMFDKRMQEADTLETQRKIMGLLNEEGAEELFTRFLESLDEEFDEDFDEDDYDDGPLDFFTEIPKPYQRDTAKINRNSPCPCGSGKKYKRCCGAAK